MSVPVPSGPAASGSKRSLPGAAAERRVQPRHFHAGPNPIAAPSDGDAADGPPPASRLHRHALESVFAFLGQGELAFALCVSRGWLAAVNSMGSLQLEVTRPSALMCVIAQSAMGRHVAALGRLGYRRATLSSDSLYVLAFKMPQLLKLTCALALPPLQAPLTFPAALREVDFLIPAPFVAAGINNAIETISRLPLLESLSITVPAFDPQLSFAPLKALTQLRFFEFWSIAAQFEDDEDDSRLSDAQLDQLRSLSWLRSLHVAPMPVDALRRLLRQPHDLQWQQIATPTMLSDEIAAPLSLLPSLTKIVAPGVTCSRFDWLRGLPNLQSVAFTFEPTALAAGQMESLVGGLQNCANIHALTLSECTNLTAAHLAALLPSLTRLRSLALAHLAIDSLAFLSLPPTSQLVSLELTHCKRLPLTKLRHVHALRGLKELQLRGSFDEPMDSHSPALYTPPSLLFPQLEKFSYSEPIFDSDSEEEVE